MSEYCPYTYGGHPVKLQYPPLFPMPSEKERDRRWKAIRNSMSKYGVDCLIVSAAQGYMPTLSQHLYYISNYVPFANMGFYLVFPLSGDPRLAVNCSLGPQFLHTALETSWITEVVESLYPAKVVIDKIRNLSLENGKLGIIGYRSGAFPASVYNALRESFPNARLEDATALLTEAEDEVSRTSEEELLLLKKACEILDKSFESVAATLKPGISELDLWAAAEETIIKNGGWYAHFMIATSGPNPVFLRAPAAHNILKSGDIVMFEINGVYGGISPQISYALSLGQPKDEVRRMFDFCEQLYHFSLLELEKDRPFLDIELDLGRQIHEAGYEPVTPQIHKYNMSNVMPMKSPPKPGDYFTVHPNLSNPTFTAGAKFGDVIRFGKDKKVQRMNRTPAKLNMV